MSKKIATTIKIDPNTYDELKILCVRHKLSLQSFMEKCVSLYINEPTFKEIINNYSLPLISGLSNLPTTTTVTTVTTITPDTSSITPPESNPHGSETLPIIQS